MKLKIVKRNTSFLFIGKNIYLYDLMLVIFYNATLRMRNCKYQIQENNNVKTRKFKLNFFYVLQIEQENEVILCFFLWHSFYIYYLECRFIFIFKCLKFRTDVQCIVPNIGGFMFSCYEIIAIVRQCFTKQHFAYHHRLLDFPRYCDAVILCAVYVSAVSIWKHYANIFCIKFISCLRDILHITLDFICIYTTKYGKDLMLHPSRITFAFLDYVINFEN